MTDAEVAILGTGLTDLSRRDQSPETMAYQAVHEALADAGVEPSELSSVIVGNALGGRLCDQGCLRGQTWLLKAGLGDLPVFNVDNSCAGGVSALHLGVRLARSDDRPVLVMGVEKMWTGDRTATIAGIEDGLPADYRHDLHDRLRTDDNPAGSILMALNDGWARQLMAERGVTMEQIAATTVKARRNASLNPKGQFQHPVTAGEVVGSAKVAGILTRLMCSSFTDGSAAIVLGGPEAAPRTRAPKIVGSVARSGNGEMDYHDRLARTAEAAWERFGFGPDEVDMVELHDATSPEELFALESLGFFGPGEAGPATLAGATAIGGALTVNSSGGLVGRGHPLAATGIAQVVELADQLRGRAGPRQVPQPRTGVAVNTGGIINGDAGFVGIHAVRAGD
jgi:acetyl-CoA acetyltransferase